MSSTRNLRRDDQQAEPLTAQEKSEMGLNIVDDEEEEHRYGHTIDDRKEVTRLPEKIEGTISLVSQESSDDGKKKINVGEYEITLPEEKLPLLGVMGCAIILHVNIFIDDSIYVSKYRYGIILSVVAFFGALVSLAIPTKKTIALNYCIYALTFAGACISTIEPGPVSQPGNGYFASWGLVISSAIAADPPGSLKRAMFNSTLNLGAAALVVILALIPDLIALIEGTPAYEVEVYLAGCGAGVTLAIVGLFLTLKVCTWNTPRNACGESIILSFLAGLWVVIACTVSFRGPFTVTGNGYFASWFAVVMSVKAAGLEWRNRVKQDEADRSSI